MQTKGNKSYLAKVFSSKTLAAYFFIYLLSGALFAIALAALPSFAITEVSQIAALGKSSLPLLQTLGILLAIAIAAPVFYILQSTTATLISQEVGKNLRALVLEKLRELAPAEFAAKNKEAEVLEITDAVATFTTATTQVFAQIVIIALVAIISLIAEAKAALLFAVLELLALICTSSVEALLYKFFVKPERAEYELMQKLRDANLDDSFTKLVEIVQFGRTQSYAQALADSELRLEEGSLSYKTKAELTKISSYAVASLFMLISAAFALELYKTQHLSMLFAVFALSYMAYSLLSTCMAAHQLLKIYPSIAAIDYIVDLLHKTPQVDAIEGGYTPEHFTGASMRNVSFSYSDDDVEVIKGLNFELLPHTFTVLSGEGGSGKTTLARLLLGIHYASEGAVVISGTRVDAIDRDSLKKLIAYVYPKTELFSGSIRDNVSLAKEGASVDDVVFAMKYSGLSHAAKDLPDGLNTQIAELKKSEYFTKISAQIGLARAFLSAADLIILDDPTQQLSAKDEVEYLAALSYHKRTFNKTVLMLTNRPRAIALADTHLYMENLTLK